TPLGAVDESVQQNAAALGDTAVVDTASASVITVAYRAYMRRTGTSESATKETIARALQAFFAAHPLGGIRLSDEPSGAVFAEAITSIIHGAVPEIFKVDLVSPSGDVPLGDGDVPVLLHDPAVHATIVTVASQGL